MCVESNTTTAAAGTPVCCESCAVHNVPTMDDACVLKKRTGRERERERERERGGSVVVVVANELVPDARIY